MVPIPTGTWHEDMIDELHSSLLGKKYDDNSDLGENEIISEANEQKGKEKNTIETDLNELRIFG